MSNKIEIIRKFNRHYLNRLNIFDSSYNNDFSITETRILYELNTHNKLTLKQLCEILNIDAGYASRIAKKYVTKGYINKVSDSNDKRSSYLSLTNIGKKVADDINKFENQRINNILETLKNNSQFKLINALETAYSCLNPKTENLPIIRTHLPGDLGTVTHFHGKYYADTYGYSEIFEAFVAKEFSEFILDFDTKKSIFYVVEKNGKVEGSIALQHRSNTSAQLRFFYLSPALRGLGIGKTLMNNIMNFAKKTKYKHIYLWTHKGLDSAQMIYAKNGFKLTETKIHSLWKENLEEQMWEVNL
jgi:DNA-binding MarR family transcriptional regulator/N-acetylglutamate synthase-like GNAT family acetyltransferase